ncbi:MAG: cytotoxic translational repressor of toxin-antitoxin stability system [Opitutae bacterium]|nr:cytotoxic translational repressor of toxin-antitoxin stability system [Opitutae bacterium]
MFQLTFSEQSMVEVNALDHVGQLELMEKLSSLTSEVLSYKNSDVGRFTRNGKSFCRMRVGELRVYFEYGEQTLHCHYILRKNTFNDFIVRFKLPVCEEQDLEKEQSFWEYLERFSKR